jgi:hypothetical protein
MSAPGGEGLFRTGDDDAAHLLVFLGGLQGLGELAQKLRVERVHGVGSVQRDERDMVFDLDDQSSHRPCGGNSGCWVPGG